MSNILEKYSETDLIDVIENDKIDLDCEEEISDETETPSGRKLYIDKVDKSTSDIIRMITEGELILQPDYQRKFVWNEKTQSQFIESLLLSIPIPTIFLAENDDDTLEVIDGQQRLTTVYSFYKSILNEDELERDSAKDKQLDEIQPLKLSGLNTLTNLNKKTLNEMDEKIQRRFKNVSLPMVIIQKDSSEDIKYDVFSRINQGSIKLNGQELLNVMYRGKLLSALNTICEGTKVDNVFGNRPILKKRFGYNEILLRAFVINDFIDTDWELRTVRVHNEQALEKKERKYGGRLNTSIIEFLKEFRNDEEKCDELETFINDSISKVEIVFEDRAFKRIDSNDSSTSINKTIAELQLVTLSRFSESTIRENKELIEKSFREFLSENTEIFLRATNNTENLKRRYNWGKVLSSKLEG
mgnify:CR=1 FL=1